MRQSSSSRSTQRSECLVVCFCHSMSAFYTPGELYPLCVLVDLSLASARKAHAQRDVSRSPKVSAFVSIVAWPQCSTLRPNIPFSTASDDLDRRVH